MKVIPHSSFLTSYGACDIPIFRDSCYFSPLIPHLSFLIPNLPVLKPDAVIVQAFKIRRFFIHRIQVAQGDITAVTV